MADPAQANQQSEEPSSAGVPSNTDAQANVEILQAVVGFTHNEPSPQADACLDSMSFTTSDGHHDTSSEGPENPAPQRNIDRDDAEIKQEALISISQYWGIDSVTEAIPHDSWDRRPYQADPELWEVDTLLAFELLASRTQKQIEEVCENIKKRWAVRRDSCNKTAFVGGSWRQKEENLRKDVEAMAEEAKERLADSEDAS